MGCNCGKGRRDAAAVSARSAVAGDTYSVYNSRGTVVYRTKNKSLALSRAKSTPGGTCKDQLGRPCS